MVPVARRNLLAEKGRLVMSVAGVACAVLLVLLVVSLYRGWSDAARVLDDLPGDVWIAQQGTRDPFRSASRLPDGFEDELRAIPGVRAAVPVLARRIGFDHDGRSLDVFFMALDAGPREAWSESIRERFLPAPGKVVIDTVLEREARVSVGGALDVDGTALEVVGVRQGGNPLFQLAFVSAADAPSLLGVEDAVGFYLLALDDDADAGGVMQHASDVVPGSEASTSRQFADATARLVDEGFLPVVGTLVAIGLLIGGAVIALTTYTATIEKAREYGVLKALGASGPFVYRIVVAQSLIVGALGALVGLGVAAVAAPWIESRVPEFVTDLRLSDAAWVLVAAIVVSVVAAWVPARRIDRIDPAVVFPRMSEPPLLLVDGLSRLFGSGHTTVKAVDGVSFVVRPGELCLVMGPSGSGKTTLLTMVGGLLRPTAGRVVLAGVEVVSLDARDLTRLRRELVGFVFQTFNLLDSLTARENVEVALNIGGVRGAAARARATELLVDSGLADRLDFPARELSGGEKQRVSIARALANDPRLLLADEPTANLDTDRGREVMELLRSLATRQGRGALVVSHDERLRAIADRVLWLEDGRLTRSEQGVQALAG